MIPNSPLPRSPGRAALDQGGDYILVYIISILPLDLYRDLYKRLEQQVRLAYFVLLLTDDNL